MPFVVHCFNQKTNTTYCYECENYKDPETGAWKSRRKLLGKLDENGKIVPTGKRGRKPKPVSEPNPEVRETKAALRKEVEREIREEVTAEYQGRLLALQEENISLKGENDRLSATLNALLRQSEEMMGTIQNSLGERQKNTTSDIPD
ncbi:MAG: hypothetical protein IJ088_12700 [Clostridia bacterium]|nr:hypothetical protein [Clostridia bacterium]